MRNSSVRKYTPVYQRIGECYSREKGFYMGPKYERGNVDLWNAIPSTKPKLCYTMLRIWRRRIGQLELLPILSRESSRKQKNKKTKRVY